MSCLIRRLPAVAALLVFCFSSRVPGAIVSIGGREDTVLSGKMLKGMEYLYYENFGDALRLFEGVKKQYPDHPVGYFLTAAALDARMYFYFSAAAETEFVQNCEKAIEVGELMMQKDPGDKWNIFFTGGAYGYLGTFQARYKRYIASFRNGWTGVSYLKKIYDVDSTFTDVLYGLGLYHYWSSKLSKLLWWMPGIGDKREEGIAQLKKVIEGGQYTSQPASTNLMWIYITEGRFDEAIAIAQSMLNKYPNNRIFSFGLAESYYYTGNCDKSESIFQAIMDISDSDEFNNCVNSLHCRLFLARIYEKNKLYYKAVAECRRALTYRFNETDKIVAADYLSEIKSILDRVSANYRPKQ
jgi:tetratricopeptide (TPR) repeat protein